MANQTKTYTIEIQLDAAQQALADTSKQLAQLDTKLAGLDRNSDAAKKIVAEMAQLAKQVESAGGTVEGLNRRLDSLKPGTIGALKQEFKDLTQQLNNTAEGSAEAEALLIRLGQVKGDIKGLKDEIKALDPEQRIAAFSNFAQGVVGAFGVATVAAETFGLSSESAEEFTKKTQGVIATLQGLDAVRNALDGETLKSIKSTLALGKAYILGGESATAASKTTRAAMLATGVGALLVLVTLLIANFDTVKEYGDKIYQRFKPQFEAIGNLISTIIDGARDLASAVTFGLVDDAAAHTIAVAKETAQTLAGIANENRGRQIAVLEAAGEDTFAIKRKQLQEELSLLKQGSQEEIKAYKDKANEIAVLDAATFKKDADAFEKQRLEAEQKEAAAEKERIARRKAAAEKRLAEEFAAFKARNQALEKIQLLSYADRLRLDIEAETKRQEEINKLGAQMSATAGKLSEQFAAEQAERTRLAAIKPLSFGENVLVRVFGVAPDQLEATKALIGAAADAVNQAVGQYYAGALADADARIEQASQRVSLLSQAQDQNRKKLEDDEKALQSATGARRDFLLAKIAKERIEEERLNAAKAKAAADEKKRIKERDQLAKESQRVSLALTAALAVEAAVSAIKEAAKTPFPANIPAIIVAGATVASGLFAAKALGNAFADGGFVTGPGGPRSDEVPAVLSNGEFVVNADATAKNRSLLEAMNANNNRVLPAGLAQLASGASGGSSDGGGSSAELAELLATGREQVELIKQLITHAATTAAKPGLIIGPAEAIAIEKQRESVSAAQQSAAL